MNMVVIIHGPWILFTVDFYLRENMFIEGSLEVKLPTIWRDGKAEVGRVREEKSRFTVFFQ